MKYFVCEGFRHIIHHYRNKRVVEENRRTEIRRLEYQLSNNRFEVLMSRVMKTDMPNRRKKKKLERLIYVRNIDGTFNHEEPIKYIVKIKLFYKEHKKRTEIDVIGGQNVRSNSHLLKIFVNVV